MQAVAARLNMASMALSASQAGKLLRPELLRRGLVSQVSDGTLPARALASLGLKQDQQLRNFLHLAKPQPALGMVMGQAHLALARGAAGAAASTTTSTTTVTTAVGGKRDTPRLKRDPERPKRPESAFLLFIQHLRQQRPELKGTQVMKVAGVEWKALAADKRKPFEEKAEANRLNYEAKMKEYVDSGKRDAWKRDPAKPKKPLTPYMRFLQEFRTSNRHLKSMEVASLGGAAWKALPAAEKAKFEKGYEREKEVYAAFLKDYKESGKEEAWKQKVGLVDKEAKAKAKAAEKLAKLAEKIKAAKEKLAKAKEGFKAARTPTKAAKQTAAAQ